MDLALAATHFPHCGLTFAILFGCSLSIEREVLKRLSFSIPEAVHPLLVPGVFAEIERARHLHVVEATIDELEGKIFELEFHSVEAEAMRRDELERRNQEKRSIWLDTTYLRNNLISWSRQLAKMANHADELEDTIYRPIWHRNSSQNWRTRRLNERAMKSEPDLAAHREGYPESGGLNSGVITHMIENPAGPSGLIPPKDSAEYDLEKMQLFRYGHKIKGRLEAIIDEYDDKIRDCSMRVDGMAMATQWVSGIRAVSWRYLVAASC
jgi:hypothetical protein